ncbi:fibronectin type III domain-containing protein [Eisenibacter elegans]|uniref:fibronectin type III domain-containing protein n=1 Tax=Eisenibacter elegans TaxID=997 RepID=UPI0004154676|nr:fibronectin type III domain-containing protein [Eisenibacter elegans]
MKLTYKLPFNSHFWYYGLCLGLWLQPLLCAGQAGRGNTISFDGSTIVQFAGDYTSGLSEGNFTIMFWVKPTQGGVGQLLFQAGFNPANIRIGLASNDEITVFIYNDGTNDIDMTSNFPIPLDVWSHIAVVVKNDLTTSQAFIFINGKLAGGQSQSAFGISLPNPGSLTLGGVLNIPPESLFQGEMDELKIYNSAKSYEADFGRLIYGRPDLSDGNLIFYTDFSTPEANFPDFTPDSFIDVEGSAALIPSTAPVGAQPGFVSDSTVFFGADALTILAGLKADFPFTDGTDAFAVYAFDNTANPPANALGTRSWVVINRESPIPPLSSINALNLKVNGANPLPSGNLSDYRLFYRPPNDINGTWTPFPDPPVLFLDCEGGQPECLIFAGTIPYSDITGMQYMITYTPTALPPNTLAPPTNLTAQATSSGIELFWQDNSLDELNFAVLRGTDSVNINTTVATLAANTTFYLDDTGVPGTSYFYRIVAQNGPLNSSPSNIATARTFRAAPNTSPTGLVATALSATRVRLTWTYAGATHLGFSILRAPDGTENNFKLIGSTLSNQLIFEDNNLQPGVIYRYQVRAFNEGGESPPSAESSVQTLSTPPFRPTGLTAAPLSLSSILLTWQDNSFDEEGFRLERSTNPNEGFAAVQTLNRGATRTTDTNLSANVTYYYRIVSFNTSGGDSDYSNIAAATTADVPLIPVNPVLTVSSSTQMVLSWTNTANNVTQFSVEMASIETNDGRFVEVAILPANTTSYSATGLRPNRLYRFRIRARNANGSSPASEVVRAFTLRNPEVAPPNTRPTNLSVNEVSEQELNITWSFQEVRNFGNEDLYYRLERSALDTNNFVEIAQINGDQTSYQDLSLQPRTLYFYRIRAANEGGESPYSEPSFGRSVCNILVLLTKDNNDRSICTDKSVLLSLTTNVTRGSIQWARNGVLIPGATQRDYYATQDGEYTCTVASGDCIRSASIPLIAIFNQAPPLRVIRDGDLLVASILGATRYQWFRNGQAIEGANLDSFRPTNAGTYFVVVTTGNCSVTSAAVVITVTGLAEGVEPSADAYPNPAQTQTTLRLQTPDQGAYRLYHISPTGAKTLLQTGEKLDYQWEQRIDISRWPAGIQFLEFVCGQERYLVKVLKN